MSGIFLLMLLQKETFQRLNPRVTIHAFSDKLLSPHPLDARATSVHLPDIRSS